MGEAISGTDAAQEEFEIACSILDIDYIVRGGSPAIRITAKGEDGKSYEILDHRFKPYLYFVPRGNRSRVDVLDMAVADSGRVIRPVSAEEVVRELFGKKRAALKVYTDAPSDIPKLAAHLSNYGECFEYDIPFSRRYALDMGVIPFDTYLVNAIRSEAGFLELASLEKTERPAPLNLNLFCFDIETYNPLGISRPDKDPVIMLSYSYRSNGKSGSGVITFKEIDLPFVEFVPDEKALFSRFIDLINEFDIDVITGYNSANFDIKYLQERAATLKVDFNLSRGGGETRIERHGLVDKVRIGGRVHVDTYLVVKFVALVGSAEHLLKLNSYTLKNVYDAISPEAKLTVEKGKIYEMWDGSPEQLRTLAEYNLTDSLALQKVYDTFIPIMIELSRTTGDVLGDTSVSTTGQLCEYMLMRYATKCGEFIPNKPSESEIKARMLNPIEGAYVKTPDPGIYENLAILDFRGLYPSIIVAHNIDPSNICADCGDYFESPIGVRFGKVRRSITPMILQQLIDQRKEVKKLYKKNPEDIFLGSRSQALKIVANSFFGYLGYARSRWYSRDCAASITAYGRDYIHKAIAEAEAEGLKVIYGDTDSLVLLLGDKSEESALTLMRNVNSKLPGMMELEVEDFYVRGVFVGKKVSGDKASGAKKKYAMLTKTGRIKIRGFELVRRDWSKIARDTQRAVLETILKDGNAEKAADIVRSVVHGLRAGSVPLKDLTIRTQLRKGIDNYDSKSPELSAAKKAVERGQKKKAELEYAVISYVITSHGSSISDKAELEEFADDYDADYYINHQVLPAVMRILKELNFSEEQLKNLGSQKKL